jgi:hypothetical protein
MKIQDQGDGIEKFKVENENPVQSPRIKLIVEKIINSFNPPFNADG